MRRYEKSGLASGSGSTTSFSHIGNTTLKRGRLAREGSDGEGGGSGTSSSSSQMTNTFSHNNSRVHKGASSTLELENGSIPPQINVIDAIPSGGSQLSSQASSIHKSADSVTNMLEQQNQQIEALQADLTRRQESYIRRERAYKTRIEELEVLLEETKEAKMNWMGNDKSMKDLKNMHKRIMGNVEIVQDRTARILQEQERDLLRAFRARLFDIQTELEEEKNRKGDGAGAWIERSRKIESELDWTTEVADRLDRMNQHILKENAQLKAQYKVQEEDRGYLVRQLVAVKKDNVRLKQDVDEARKGLQAKEEEVDRLQAKGALGGASRATTRDLIAAVVGGGGDEGRGGDGSQQQMIIRRLKRGLEVERKNAKVLREKLGQKLKDRTELQSFLRACLDDVKKQIQQTKEGVSPSIEDLTSTDRGKALNLLLSQERVVSLLYNRAFPLRNTSPSEASLSAAAAAEGKNNGLLYDNQIRPVSAPFGHSRQQQEQQPLQIVIKGGSSAVTPTSNRRRTLTAASSR